MLSQAVFKKDCVTSEGTYMRVFVPGVNIGDEYFVGGIANGTVSIDDGRSISASQRGLLFALFADIAVAVGYGNNNRSKEKVKELMKDGYIAEANVPRFSLSNVAMNIASDFIDYVLEFTFENGVPLKFKTMEVAKECRSWSYICFKHRECTICRKANAHVHHIEAVGQGMDRNKVDHSKIPLIMVCADHHIEAHSIGWITFSNKYHVAGIFVKVEVLRALNIRGNYGEEANV